jgi:hypothetical protein
VVQAFPSNRANQTFHVSVLPGRMRGCQYFVYVHPENGLPEGFSVTTISIPDQKSWSLIPGERFQHLLRRPFQCRMSRDFEMQYSSAMMLQHNEHEQEPEAQRGHYEEINRDELLSVIFQECPPRLGRRLPVSRHVFGNRGFRHLDPEFQQFPMNSGRTPGWIRQAHFTDQRSNLGGNFRSARTAIALPSSVKTKSFSMPGNDSRRLDDDQSRTPAGPNLGEPNPEKSVCSVKLNPTPL